MHSMTNLRFLKRNQETIRATNNNKQPCSCQTSLRNLLFHLVQRISLHLESPAATTREVVRKWIVFAPSQLAGLCCSNTLAYGFSSKRETARSLFPFKTKTKKPFHSSTCIINFKLYYSGAPTRAWDRAPYP